MTAAEEQAQAPMMRPMRGMMGHGGMMLQQHVEWLSQQLKLRGCPETSQPRCAAFKPLADDIGKQDKIAVKACSA